MSILIKGLEMPASCPCELLGNGYDLYCSFAGGIPARVKEYYECCQNGTRPSWCPLVPISQHGRLIDAYTMITSVKRQTYFLKSMGGDLATVAEILEKGILQEIENAPTVIPASEEART